MDMNKVYGIPLDFLVYKAEELLWERYEAAERLGNPLPFYVPLEYARDCHFSIRNSEGVGGNFSPTTNNEQFLHILFGRRIMLKPTKSTKWAATYRLLDGKLIHANHKDPKIAVMRVHVLSVLPNAGDIQVPRDFMTLNNPLLEQEA
jgi:hypothetical protein